MSSLLHPMYNFCANWYKMRIKQKNINRNLSYTVNSCKLGYIKYVFCVRVHTFYFWIYYHQMLYIHCVWSEKSWWKIRYNYAFLFHFYFMFISAEKYSESKICSIWSLQTNTHVQFAILLLLTILYSFFKFKIQYFSVSQYQLLFDTSFLPTAFRFRTFS